MDIDTDSIVQKYLEKNDVVSDPSADKGDEVTAVIQTIATTLLLYPRAILPIINRAKNTLQQLVTEDLDLLDSIKSAIEDLNNPVGPVNSTSSLVEAQTALLELDRLQKVSLDSAAYIRYKSSITDFLNKQLAPFLLRQRKGMLERNGLEARQDILEAFSLFKAVHSAIIQRKTLLENSLSEFESVELDKVVSSKTLSSVRDIISQIAKGSSFISKTVMAVELLAGDASLQTISATEKATDPLIDSLNLLPGGRSILAYSNTPAATIKTSEGPWYFSIASPWNLIFSIDGGGSSTVELPTAGASERVFIISDVGSGTYPINLISGAAPHLYIRVEEGNVITDKNITLTTGGSVSLATVVADITAGLGGKGTCQELFSGSNRLVIFGANTVTKLTVLPSFPGTIDLSGYHPANPSAHVTLGFKDNQTSLDLRVMDASTLMILLAGRVNGLDVYREGEFVRLSTTSATKESSLSITGSLISILGVGGTFFSLPTSLSLKEGFDLVDPSSLKILTGSTAYCTETEALPGGKRNLIGEITQVSDRLFFNIEELPRGFALPITIIPKMTSVITTLVENLKKVPSLEEDIFNITKVISPLLGNPTRAQIEDTLNALKKVRDKLSFVSSPLGLLDTLKLVSVKDSEINDLETSNTIIRTLEERGLDRAETILIEGSFSTFFQLTSNNASRASRLLNAIEQVGQEDLIETTIEADIPDKLATTGPSSSIQNKESSL